MYVRVFAQPSRQIFRNPVVERFRDLRAYHEAFGAARRIYEHSTDWPKGEGYALTAQIRRSFRAVKDNVAEAWRKRLSPTYFVSKLSDADAEAAETRSWLDFAVDHGYIAEEFHVDTDDRCDKIQGSLVKMVSNPNRWCGSADEVCEEHTGYFTSGPFPK